MANLGSFGGHHKGWIMSCVEKTKFRLHIEEEGAEVLSLEAFDLSF